MFHQEVMDKRQSHLFHPPDIPKDAFLLLQELILSNIDVRNLHNKSSHFFVLDILHYSIDYHIADSNYRFWLF